MKVNLHSFSAQSVSVRRFFNRIKWVCVGTISSIVTTSLAAGSPTPVAVNSRVSDDYVRIRQADGTFAPEYFAFGEGGYWGGNQHDDSIDKLKFIDVARTIAGPLARQNYLSSRSADETKLLIMVYWGMTDGSKNSATSNAYQTMVTRAPPVAGLTQLSTGPSGAWGNSLTAPALPSAVTNGQGSGAESQVPGAPNSVLDSLLMAQRAQLQQDVLNAMMLGFADEMIAYEPLKFTAARNSREKLYDEIENNRYFVVLQAYDFQLLQTQKKHKLLWETRYSLREAGNDFSEQLAAMTQAAARYFGQPSKGLRRQQLPETKIKFGEFKVIEYSPGK